MQTKRILINRGIKSRKILIVGQQNVGKTQLAELISSHLNIPIFDEISGLDELTRNEGVYVSNSIPVEVAQLELPTGFVLIHINFQNKQR